MWQCQECNETIESTLDVCWNCGTSRDGRRDPDFKPADDYTPSDAVSESQAARAFLAPGPVPPDTLPNIKFGLRTLLGVVGICALVFAIVSWYQRPRTSVDFHNLGMAHLEAEEYSESITDLSHALELSEEEGNQRIRPVIYAARALAFNNQGEFAKSLEDISHAIDLLATPFDIPGVLPANTLFIPQETVTDWRVLRANALIGLENKEEAVRELKIVLKHDPMNKEAWHLLAIAENRGQANN